MNLRHNKQHTFYTKDKTDSPLDLDDVTIEYPFKSKVKYNSIKDQLVNKKFNPTPDSNPIKQQRKFQRPYYSPKFLNWEADLVFFTSKTHKPITYMFVINVNTKFLYVIYLSNKTEDEMINAFMNLLHMKSNNVQCPNGIRINGLRFDGESALNSKRMKTFYDKNNINVYSNSSSYINKNRIVDRVIRTIRTAFDSLDCKNLGITKHRSIMQQIVSLYNNTIHKSTGLKPIEMTFEDELEFIKNKDSELKQQLSKQTDEFDYKFGDDLMVYIPKNKTEIFSKQHIYYSTPAKFIDYYHGNVLCEVEELGTILLPIYYTRLV